VKLQVQPPPQKPQRPPVILTVGAGSSLQELDAKVREGSIESYSQVGDTVTITTNEKTNLEELKKFAAPKAPSSIVQKATQVFVPPNMDEVCAPEYAQLRFWQVAGGVLGGALGYCGAATMFQSQQASFPNGAGIAMAGAWNSYVGLAANTAASMTVARMGDVDPKRVALYSGLWSTANTFAQYAGATFLPSHNLPVSLALNVSGAFAGNLGGSAGSHVANHLVVEHARGTVGAINGNQDRFAGLLGTPLGIGVQYACHKMGFQSALVPIGILGGALLLCNLQQINSMRFESVDRAQMEKLVGALLDGQEPESVKESGLWSTVKDVFSPAPEQEGSILHLNDAQELLQDERIGLLASEDYLVGLSAEGKSKLVFRNNCSVNSLIRGTAHALLLKRAEHLRSVAEEVAPGKAERVLTELAYRALPGGSSWKDQLSLKGWHIHPTRLKVGSENRWRAKPEAVNTISQQEWNEVLASPSPERLRQALQGSPLLAS
jgi:hypothetical protein